MKVLVGIFLTGFAALGALQETGVVTGRILHSDGTPSVGTRVVAVDVKTADGTDRLYVDKLPSARTDAQGRFRLEKLAAAQYYIATGSESYFMGGSNPSGTGFLFIKPLYFPGVRVQSQARTFVVEKGMVAETELQLLPESTPPSPTFKVNGRVVGELPYYLQKPAGIVQVCFIAGRNSGPCLTAKARSGVGPDGAFELRDVPSGQYGAILQFIIGDGSSTVISQTVSVVDRNITNLVFDVNSRTVSEIQSGR